MPSSVPTNRALGGGPGLLAHPARRPSVALHLMLGVAVLSFTVLERFGINLGVYSIGASLIAIYLLCVVAALSGCLALSIRRLLLFSACMSVACASYWVNTHFAHRDRSSSSSLLLLAVTYIPFVFTIRRAAIGDDANRVMFRKLLDVALFCALAGIVQFYAQFVVHARWLFDFTSLLPEILRGPTGYNTVIPVGSHFKSNGFFFREPSGFSFMMALAILAEWAGERRISRLGPFGLALLLSYSGTGILTLIIGLLFPLGRKTFARIAVVAGVGLVVFWILGDVLDLSFTLKRVQEFGSERSSAYSRYIAPLLMLVDTIGDEPWTFWLGHGPGAISHVGEGGATHVTHLFDPTWAKLLFEYGVLGFVLFISLYLLVLSHSTAAQQLRAVLFFSWLVMGGHLLTPEHNVLTLALVGLFPLVSRRREKARWSLGSVPIGAEPRLQSGTT